MVKQKKLQTIRRPITKEQHDKWLGMSINDAEYEYLSAYPIERMIFDSYDCYNFRIDHFENEILFEINGEIPVV